MHLQSQEAALFAKVVGVVRSQCSLGIAGALVQEI